MAACLAGQARAMTSEAGARDLPPVDAPGPAAARGPWRARLEQFRALSLIGVLLLIWIAFQFLTNGLFLSPRNLTTLAVQVASTAILAAGIVLVMVPGCIDLSIGSAVAFTGMVATLLVDSACGLGWTTDRGDLADDSGRPRDRRLAGILGGLAAGALLHRHAGQPAGLARRGPDRHRRLDRLA
jgi:ribose/xylose/arabinose/galactoside ABC-type transport system permease subunit